MHWWQLVCWGLEPGGDGGGGTGIGREMGLENLPPEHSCSTRDRLSSLACAVGLGSHETGENSLEQEWAGGMSKPQKLTCRSRTHSQLLSAQVALPPPLPPRSCSLIARLNFLSHYKIMSSSSWNSSSCK